MPGEKGFGFARASGEADGTRCGLAFPAALPGTVHAALALAALILTTALITLAALVLTALAALTALIALALPPALTALSLPFLVLVHRFTFSLCRPKVNDGRCRRVP